MLSKKAKYVISSSFVKVFIGKEQFTFKEKDNIEIVKKLIKTEVLKTLANSIVNDVFYKTIKAETNLKRIVSYLRKTSVVNEELFKTFVNALGMTNRKKPREQLLMLLAKYIKNNEYELECTIIEEYIKVLAKNELLLENFVNSEGVDDDELEDEDDELEDKPISKKSKKAKNSKKKYDIKISEGKVSIDGEDLNTDAELVKHHIIKSVRSGVTKTVYHKFLTKVKNNPKKYIEDELFRFLESGNFPIAEDGDFYAFKKVEFDYKDNHSHSIDNRPGKIVTMPRKKVCSDRTKTCSTGLHFASLDYAKDYCGNRLMILKINPKDVVSIPDDYKNQKGRCCRYKVICELSDIDMLNISHKDFLRKIASIEAKNDKILKNVKLNDELHFVKF